MMLHAPELPASQLTVPGSELELQASKPALVWQPPSNASRNPEMRPVQTTPSAFNVMDTEQAESTAMTEPGVTPPLQ